MVYMPHDVYVGRSFHEYGEFSPSEVRLLRSLVEPGDVALDIGANIGAITKALAAKAVKVHAFEPQPFVCGLLKMNTAGCILPQDCVHADVHNHAIGEKGLISMPKFDYSVENNYGAVSNAEWEPANTKDGTIDKFPIDDYICKPATCQVKLIKVDVEGMELEVLRSGAETIKQAKPLLFVECDRPDTGPALIDYLYEINYTPYWAVTALYEYPNFNRNSNNVFGTTCSFNLLCIPEGRDKPWCGDYLVPARSDNAIGTWDLSKVLVVRD
jgi:FkbM family methyltransferase